MDLEEIIGAARVNASLKSDCLQILDIYRSLEEAQNSSSVKAGIYCGSGCGACCIRHEAQISAFEGRFAALIIHEKRKDLAVFLDNVDNRKHCVFYDPENPLHCRIHAFRPLLCRTFHFCAYRNKAGQAVYRPCFMMKEKISVPDPEILPKSEDYGWRLSALDPALKPEILPISEAVSKAYRQLTYTMNLMETARETSPA